jgi:hypothetical protein
MARKTPLRSVPPAAGALYPPVTRTRTSPTRGELRAVLVCPTAHSPRRFRTSANNGSSPALPRMLKYFL